jgi:hypothetical protein
MSREHCSAPGPNSEITMAKISHHATLIEPGHALLAIALDKIIPAHQAIDAARHRSRRHPSELYPKWRPMLGAVVRSNIEADRKWMGRKQAFPPHPIDVFGTDDALLKYVLFTVMPERTELVFIGDAESDHYPRWAHEMKGMVQTAVVKDRTQYGGTKRTEA